jgi:hypothetical protein
MRRTLTTPLIILLLLPLALALGSCWRDPVTAEQVNEWREQADELSALIEQGREHLPALREAARRAASRVREARQIAERVGGEQALAAVDRAAALADAAAERVSDVERTVADAAIGLRAVRSRLEDTEPGTPIWKAILGTVGSAIAAIVAGRYIPGSQRLAWRIMGRPRERLDDARRELERRG